MGPRLGPYNLALVACYAAPTWGAEAIKALTSPCGGLIDPVHAAAAVRLRAILKLAPERLLDVANWLAAFKLVVGAALLAYVIEFARAVLSDRAPDRRGASCWRSWRSRSGSCRRSSSILPRSPKPMWRSFCWWPVR